MINFSLDRTGVYEDFSLDRIGVYENLKKYQVKLPVTYVYEIKPDVVFWKDEDYTNFDNYIKKAVFNYKASLEIEDGVRYIYDTWDDTSGMGFHRMMLESEWKRCFGDFYEYEIYKSRAPKPEPFDVYESGPSFGRIVLRLVFRFLIRFKIVRV